MTSKLQRGSKTKKAIGLEKIMTTPKIKSVKAAEKEKAIDIVVQAFSADPAARWLYPDFHEYIQNFPDFVRAFGGKAFDQGIAYTVDGFGAALWLPPDFDPDDESLAGLIQRSVPEHRLEEVFAVFQQMDDYHPNEPHWYFAAHWC